MRLPKNLNWRFDWRAIVNHPRFVFVLTAWGALTPALGVLALSSVDIARVSMVLGLGALGPLAKIVYAGIAAVIGGLGLFVVAMVTAGVFGERATSWRGAPRLPDDVRPIDPAQDLGSESLDAPLKGALHADEVGEESWDDETPGNAGAEATVLYHEPSAALGEDAPVKDDAAWVETAGEDDALEGIGTDEEDASRSDKAFDDTGLDLAAFTAIVEEETLAYEAHRAKERAAREAANAPPSSPAVTGIAKLRAVPPQELSLVQLVERFAAALHDAQKPSPHPGGAIAGDRAQAAREDALAQALKALKTLTHGDDGPAAAKNGPLDYADPVAASLSETERDLHQALTRLQSATDAA